jgi:hypothetical protein
MPQSAVHVRVAQLARTAHDVPMIKQRQGNGSSIAGPFIVTSRERRNQKRTTMKSKKMQCGKEFQRSRAFFLAVSATYICARHKARAFNTYKKLGRARTHTHRVFLSTLNIRTQDMHMHINVQTIHKSARIRALSGMNHSHSSQSCEHTSSMESTELASSENARILQTNCSTIRF